ncbi:glycosyl hydrolase family 28-related protein [Ruania rhizosphaerae]|uniref:glycosyl hydrolase family 28-related protein n=1 Tax=Ruania rhizosphaerae TaxID=1840413 RepID=UPI00135AEB38|nr:glycosyl hydrolase family 28-related protein [Ruania rhizosphaerae]
MSSSDRITTHPTTTPIAGSNRRSLLTRGLVVAAGGAAAVVGSTSGATPASATTTDTLLDQGGAVFNAKAYGAVGDGTSDDTAAINSTIAAAVADGGGVVFLPQGAYLVSGTLSVDTDGISLVGAGRGATVIKTTGYTSGDILHFDTVRKCSVRQLSINAESHRSSGAAIHLDSSEEVYVQDIDMTRQFAGCIVDGGGVLQYIDRGYWTSFTNGGVGIWINASNSNDTMISNITMDQNETTGSGVSGVRIQGSQAVWMRDCDIIRMETGLLIDPPAGETVSWLFFTSCAFDTCRGPGIEINPASTAHACKGIEFVNCWTATSQYSDGVHVAGEVDGLQLIGHRSFQNAGHGVIVNGPARNVSIDACAAAGNGNPNGGTGGFTFAGGATDFAVRNCRTGLHAALPNTQDHGIRVTSDCDRYVITSNHTLGNLTAGITDNGGPNKVVANNL